MHPDWEERSADRAVSQFALISMALKRLDYWNAGNGGKLLGIIREIEHEVCSFKKRRDVTLQSATESPLGEISCQVTVD